MEVKVYSTPTCPYCRMVKEFLSERGVAYRDVDVSHDFSAAQELMSRTGRRAVPVTIIDGQTVVGFDRAQLEQALATAQARPALGAAITDASKMATPPVPGAYVGTVHAGSAAEKMGLAPGDIIIELGQYAVGNAAELEKALSSLSKGSRISLVYLRNGRSQTAQGVLA